MRVYGKEHDVQSHTIRATITDMQDKSYGNGYDLYFIQSQYKGNHKSGGAAEGCATFVVAMNRVDVVDLVVDLVDVALDVDLVDVVSLSSGCIFSFWPLAVPAVFLPGCIWGLPVLLSCGNFVGGFFAGREHQGATGRGGDASSPTSYRTSTRMSKIQMGAGPRLHF